jgi:hypothetical protein
MRTVTPLTPFPVFSFHLPATRPPPRLPPATPRSWEEYYDYIFPEEESKAPSLKILEMAQQWKKRKLQADDGQVDGQADE